MAKQGSVSSQFALGFQNIAGRIARIYPETIAAIRAANQEAGAETVEMTRATVPVDTGRMRDFVKDVYGRDGLSFDVGWDEADFTAQGVPFYPIFVEFGTRKMAARPSLGPAYERAKARYQLAVSRHIRLAIEQRRGER